jgi:hypothetical protein
MEYYKILNEDMKHYDFQYKEGLNILKEEFNPSTEECSKGGLYFTTEEHVLYWIVQFKNASKIGKVTLCEDSRVVKYSNKSKTDKFILSDILPKKEWVEKNVSKEDCLAVVYEHGYALEVVPEKLRDKEMCLKAVSQWCYALQFVPEKLRDREMCLKAVSREGYVLEHVPENLKDKEMCLKAVSNDGLALYYVPEKLRDKEMCFAAVSEYEGAMLHVPENLKSEMPTP